MKRKPIRHIFARYYFLGCIYGLAMPFVCAFLGPFGEFNFVELAQTSPSAYFDYIVAVSLVFASIATYRKVKKLTRMRRH